MRTRNKAAKMRAVLSKLSPEARMNSITAAKAIRAAGINKFNSSEFYKARRDVNNGVNTPENIVHEKTNSLIDEITRVKNTMVDVGGADRLIELVQVIRAIQKS